MPRLAQMTRVAVIDERAALVGVELAGHAPAANSFLEAAVETTRVGAQIVSGVGQHPRMVVNDGAQVRGRRLLLAGQMEEGTRGKVHHPQLIDQRRFKRFGWPADGLAHQVMARALVQVMTLERPVDGAQGWQDRVLLLPLPVEHLDGNSRMGPDLRDDEPLLLGGELARDSAVRAAFGMQAGKAPAPIGIPPVFERAPGHRMRRTLRMGQRRRRGDRLQGDFERHRLRQELLDFANETKTSQGHGLGSR